MGIYKKRSVLGTRSFLGTYKNYCDERQINKYYWSGFSTNPWYFLSKPDMIAS